MSLIEEALRRVQTLPPPVERPETVPQAPEVRVIPSANAAALPRQIPASSIPWRGVVVGAAGVLVLGWGIWTLAVILSTTTPSRPQPVSRPAQHLRLRSVQPPASRRPIMSLSTRPPLELSGVVGGPGEPMAIINGRILAPGQTIEGATLLEVTDDSARLRWRDEDIVLQLSH